jgi:uncharacterized protein
MPATLPLEGLFFHLVRHGFPLSVRDYQDAVLALRRGYGSPRREDLHWLCETLWARTEQEVSRLDRLFREFPWPTDDVWHDLTSPGGDRPAQRKQRSKETAGNQSSAPDQALPVLEFTSPTESGVGLPSAVTTGRAQEVFILSARPQVSLRSLIIAWRRFRIAQRSGPRIDLDLEATVAAQSRDRVLVEPVFLPARRNQARLVILVDASESMVAWRSMNRVIAESLERSQLGHAAMYYFDDVPDDEIYTLEMLSRPVALKAAFERHAECALLIVSDAGAGRGRTDRERVRQVRDFVNRVKETWHPIAWLNPMPTTRWRHTTAEGIARLDGVSMFPFTEDSLIEAVDYLRGKRD